MSTIKPNKNNNTKITSVRRWKILFSFAGQVYLVGSKSSHDFFHIETDEDISRRVCLIYYDHYVTMFIIMNGRIDVVITWFCSSAARLLRYLCPLFLSTLGATRLIVYLSTFVDIGGCFGSEWPFISKSTRNQWLLASSSSSSQANRTRF